MGICNRFIVVYDHLLVLMIVDTGFFMGLLMNPILSYGMIEMKIMGVAIYKIMRF